MKKYKVLVATDASFLASGYGIYAKEILSRMHKSSKYEVAELSCYAMTNSDKLKTIPWKTYPNAVDTKDERYKTYSENKINQFGAWRFTRTLLDFKPDIVLTWTDYWMYSYQETNPLRKYFYWIQMPMVDSAPQKIEWLYTYANADAVIPYTMWAKKTLSDACGNQISLFDKPANAGINSNEFFRLDNKKELRKKYFGEEDVDVIGTVMRNQKRKLFPDILQIFRDYLKRLKDENKLDKYNKTYLYLHTSYPEEVGWNFPTLLLEYELLDKVYFSYVCRNCGNFSPSKFVGAVKKCDGCGGNTASMPSVSYGVDTKTLNIVYNLFDFYLQYAIAEGFGMPAVEAAACGIPFASVDYSAMSEIADNLSGIKIPVERIFREIETNADRVYPDNKFTLDLIYNFFNIMTDRYKIEWSNNIQSKCYNIYTWDNVYEVWDQCITSVVSSRSKLPWSSPQQKTNHGSMSVPSSLNTRDFIWYICNNIINDSYLFETSNIQSLIKDVVDQLVVSNSVIHHIDKQKVVEILENHLNNKIMCEDYRTSPNKLKKEDYL